MTHLLKSLHSSQSGQLLILSLAVFALLLIDTVLIIGNSLNLSQTSKYSLQDVQAINLAEAGLDKAVATLNKSPGQYSGEGETTLGIGTFEVSVTTIDSSTKQITATGYIPNKAQSKVKRTVSLKANKGEGVSFSYAMQAGQGGLEMSSGPTINGTVYSNGNVTMSGGGGIFGDLYIAGGTLSSANQSVDCSSPNCGDQLFGKNISGQDILDIAQSFKPSTTTTINKVSLKVKKIGNPPDVTVRVMTDSGGNPNKNSVLTSGILYSSLVTTQYGWVDVTFTTNPTLTTETTYWLVIDTSSNASNYWSWGADTTQSYVRGQPKWSPNWQSGNPTWNSIPVDLNFQIYMGGVNTGVFTSGGPTISGEVHANTINAQSGTLTIGDEAYYQTISGGVQVHGSSCTNNPYCHPASSGPAVVNMPISDSNIQFWKDASEDAGVYTGDISGCQTSIGPGKYVGNINLSGGCRATMTDPVWITGNFSISGGAIMSLPAQYGTNSGVFMTDGTIRLSGGGQVIGSGIPGSYMVGISTYNSQQNGNTAIDLSGGSTSTIFYAPYGIITMSGGATMRELTAWKLRITGGGSVTYEAGLANLSFTTSPSGSYSVIKGSYKVH